MNKFEIRRGDITFSIPTEIDIVGEKVHLNESHVRDERIDYEGNLCAVELRFETELTGRIALFIKNSYDELVVSYGTLDEEESMEWVDYEHPEDKPYDILPEEEVSELFVDHIRIIENGYRP